MIDHQPAVLCFDRLRTRTDLQEVPHLAGARPHDDRMLLFGNRKLQLIHVGYPDAGFDAVIDDIFVIDLFREEEGIFIPDIPEGKPFALPSIKSLVDEVIDGNRGCRDLGNYPVIGGVQHDKLVTDDHHPRVLHSLLFLFCLRDKDGIRESLQNTITICDSQSDAGNLIIPESPVQKIDLILDAHCCGIQHIPAFPGIIFDRVENGVTRVAHQRLCRRIVLSFLHNHCDILGFDPQQDIQQVIIGFPVPNGLGNPLQDRSGVKTQFSMDFLQEVVVEPPFFHMGGHGGRDSCSPLGTVTGPTPGGAGNKGTILKNLAHPVAVTHRFQHLCLTRMTGECNFLCQNARRSDQCAVVVVFKDIISGKGSGFEATDERVADLQSQLSSLFGIGLV